jgi:hypothetical protein
LHQGTNHGGAYMRVFCTNMVVVWAYLRVFCTKGPTMVGVGAYMRVFCTKRPAMVVVEGVLHQETSHGGGGGLLVGVQSKMDVMGLQKRDKTKSYHLRNAIIHFLTIWVYLPKNYNSLCPS